MKSLGIYEVRTHENNLYVHIRVAIAAGYDVNVFTTKKIRERMEQIGISSSAISWYIKKESESLRNYLTRVEKVCSNKIDVLYIQYIPSDLKSLYDYTRFRPECDVCASIYNINNWSSDLKLTQRPIQNIRLLLYSKILNKLDMIAVEYSPMKKYIQNNTSISTDVYTFVPAIFEDGCVRENRAIKFTIPGYIRSDRRNYDYILDIFERIFDDYGDKVKLELLGKPRGSYGTKVIKKCEQLEKKGYSIYYYTDWISVSDFEKSLNTSDFLIAPLISPITKNGQTEEYGKTKGCGTLLDSIRTCTPVILPDHFQICEDIARAIIQYSNSSHLEDTIRSIIENQNMVNRKREETKFTYEQYNIDRQSKRFEDMIQKTKTN